MFEDVNMKKLDTHKERVTLIYDGKCPVCAGTMKWIRKNEFNGSFDMLACQAEQRAEHFPQVTRSECMRSMHLVLSDGMVLVGEEAIPEILKRLKGFRFVALLFKLPGAAALSRLAYRWFADRRYRIAAILSPLIDPQNHAAPSRSTGKDCRSRERLDHRL